MIITQLPLIFYELDYCVGRLNIALLILQTLSNYEKFNKLNIVLRKKMIYEFELHIFNKIRYIFAIKHLCDKNNRLFNIMYTNFAYDSIFHISNKVYPINTELVDKILTFKLNLYDYVNMDFKKVNENLNKTYELVKMSRMNIHLNDKYSKLFKCPRCKHKEVTYENRYNRSFDEAVNKTFYCNFCQYSWNG